MHVHNASYCSPSSYVSKKAIFTNSVNCGCRVWNALHVCSIYPLRLNMDITL